MADIAEEVVQHLKSLQAADDARRYLALRYARLTNYSLLAAVIVTLHVEHRDGRKLYVLQKIGVNNTFQFEANDLDKVLALFCEIGRQHFNSSFNYSLEIYDKSNGDVLSKSDVNHMKDAPLFPDSEYRCVRVALGITEAAYTAPPAG